MTRNSKIINSFNYLKHVVCMHNYKNNNKIVRL